MKKTTNWDRYYRRRREENFVAIAKLVFGGSIVLLYVVLNILGM